MRASSTSRLMFSAMMSFSLGLLLVVFAVAAAAAAAADSQLSPPLVYEVSHDLGEGFVPRGTVEFANMGSNRGTARQVMGVREMDAIQALASSNKVYRVRVRRQGGEVVEEKEGAVAEAIGYVAACALKQSAFAETLVISLDDNGNPQALEVRTSTSECPASSPSASSAVTTTTGKNNYNFKTVVLQGRRANVVPEPFMDNYINELERKRGAPGANVGEEPANQSFLGKYVR